MKEAIKFFIISFILFVLLGCNNAKLITQGKKNIEPEVPMDDTENIENIYITGLER